MEMTKYKLGDLCRIASAKRIFENEYVDFGVPFVRGQEISDGSLLDQNSVFDCYISKERYEEIKQKYGKPSKGDILITAVGTIGNLCYLDKDIDFYFKDGNVIWFSDIKDFCCGLYLYHFMKGLFFKDQLKYYMIGAVQKALTMDMLKKVNVPLPSLSEQKKIAAVLSALDDKIALNKKMNQKLEAMAKRLYDYWFVQFDFPDENGRPYKTSGGPMVYNETLNREIPTGWEVKSLFDCSDVLYGFPYATEPFDEENLDASTKPYPVIRIRDIKDNTISAKTTETVGDKYRTKVNDLLIGMDGYFHMSFWPRNDDYVNQRIVRIRQKQLSVLIIYHQIAPFIKFKENQAKGSTVGHLSDKDMKQINILVPNNSQLSEKFDSVLNLITKNKQEISRLTVLRDKLLPLLMNGQVEIC